jgi:hypothetical protein
MPPSPAVDYYWPPTLTDAVAGYERDMQAAKQDQVPVDRVLILGAGFSAAFQFTTARDIVTGTLGWAEHCQGSDWLARTYRQVRLESNLYKDGAWSPNGVQTRRP